MCAKRHETCRHCGSQTGCTRDGDETCRSCAEDELNQLHQLNAHGLARAEVAEAEGYDDD